MKSDNSNRKSYTAAPSNDKDAGGSCRARQTYYFIIDIRYDNNTNNTIPIYNIIIIHNV